MGGDRPKHVYFLTIDKAKFRKPVVPGDTVEYHMNKIARKKNMWWFRGEAKVGGQMVAEAEVGAMIVVNRLDDRSNRARSSRARRSGTTRRSDLIASWGPHVDDRRRLPAGGPRACRRPHHDRARAPCFIRLPRSASPPQSVKYRGGPTRLLVGADCDIRENVTMNTGTEDGGGVTEVGDRCFLMVGSHVGHDCKVGNDVTFANNVVLGGHVAIGDNVVFGGQAAVRQFVRIGEGAMIVGLSGVRADVIPFGLVQGPLANLMGLNVVGMRRRGFSRTDIHLLRRAYEAMFFGAGTFRERLDQVAAQSSSIPLVAKVIAFIRAGSRPLTMAIRRGSADEEP